jgi:hypothetical protein
MALKTRDFRLYTDRLPLFRRCHIGAAEGLTCRPNEGDKKLIPNTSAGIYWKVGPQKTEEIKDNIKTLVRKTEWKAGECPKKRNLALAMPNIRIVQWVLL